MDNGSEPNSEPSFISLVRGIASDAKDLLMQEAALTKLELQCELRKAKTTAIALGIGVGTFAIGGILLMLMLVHALAAFTVVPLWACYGIVGIVLFALGGILLTVAKTKTEALNVVPQPTVERMKETAQWLTKPSTSNAR